MRIRFLGKIGFRNVMNDRVADLVVFHPDSVSATRYPSFSCQAYSFDHWLFAALFLCCIFLSSNIANLSFFGFHGDTPREFLFYLVFGLRLLISGLIQHHKPISCWISLKGIRESIWRISLSSLLYFPNRIKLEILKCSNSSKRIRINPYEQRVLDFFQTDAK